MGKISRHLYLHIIIRYQFDAVQLAAVMSSQMSTLNSCNSQVEVNKSGSFVENLFVCIINATSMSR